MERLILSVCTREALLLVCKVFCRGLKTLVVFEIIEKTGRWRPRVSNILINLWVVCVTRCCSVSSEELLLTALVEVFR